MRLLLGITLLLLSGCGYHVQGHGSNLPPGVQTVRIPVFANRTLEPFLESQVTNAVLERFARGRALELVARGGDAILIGQIAGYSTDPIAYDSNDDIAEYRSVMTLEAQLEEAESGRILWRGTLSWNEDYPAGLDKNVQEDNEAEAIRVLAERMADELYFRVIDDF